MADAIRMLAVDSVEKAGSGHPGAPMGMAEIAVALWHRHLKHNPANPRWPDRDFFVLSNGHGSMLLYVLLHLTGYDLPMEELKAWQEAVLPSMLPAVAVEAAHPDSWRKYVGRRGAVVGIATFGESAPAGDLYVHFGITAEAVASAARRVLGVDQ